MENKATTTAYDLLRKTELRIEHIHLQNANLSDIAHCVAQTIGLATDDVLVVDCREDTLTLDILKPCVNAANLVGKKNLLQERLNRLPGVTTSPQTSFTSDGMLGWISLEEKPAQAALLLAEQKAMEIMKAVSRRVVVFSSGREVAEKQIEDTNTPAIVNRLESEGYRVFTGETLKDDRHYIAAKLREAADNGGYGVIVTTGGVGAENKDNTVEAIQMLDPQAATPYICHYKIGTGRHVKDGIKVAVGKYNGVTIIALPGPNDEVRASLDVVVKGLKENQSKRALSENIAEKLRKILRAKIH
jgi:molybdenum cofactor synthesis domain-containing protein